MTHKFLLTIAAALAVTGLQAQTVNNTAGNLAKNITNRDMATLTVAGTMNAVDFKFISDHMDRLAQVDLSQATIVAYQGKEALIGTQSSFEAGTLPPMSFMGKKQLSRVALPQGVTTIGYAAFAGCDRLTSIALPATLDSIGSYAFSATGLTTVNLPQSVTRLGDGVWARCLSLTSANIPNAAVGRYAFQGDTKLSQVTLGNGVTAIGTGAFGGCTTLQSPTLEGNAITVLSNEAFINSGLTGMDLSLQFGLDKIGDWAFAGTPVTQVGLSSNVSSIGEGAFYYANQLSTLILPSSVTRIGSYAMAGATGLATLQSKARQVPALGDSVWARVNQPAVTLKAISTDYRTAEQWKNFNVVVSYLRGDVNIDDVINAGDITAIVDYILNEKEVGDFNIYAAELTNDGIVNTSDVTELVEIILSSSTTVITKAGVVSTADDMHIDNFDIAPGQTRAIEVKLNNADAYNAFECDIVPPAGMSLDEAVTPAPRADGYVLASRLQPDGSLRVVGYSLNAGAQIASGTEALFTINVTAGNDLPAQAQMQVTNTVLATPQAVALYAAPTTALVSSTTGIDNINANQVHIWADGCKLIVESQQAGTAQLVMMNGMARTMLVQSGHNEYDGLEPGIYVVRMGGQSVKVAIR